jgi:hypothetical protein
MDGTPTSQPLIGNYGTVGSVSFAKALNPDWAARPNETYTGRSGLSVWAATCETCGI